MYSKSNLAALVLWIWAIGSSCTADDPFQRDPVPRPYRSNAYYHQAGNLTPVDSSTETPSPKTQPAPTVEIPQYEIEHAISKFQQIRASSNPEKDSAWVPFLKTAFEYSAQPINQLAMSPLIRARVAAEFELDSQKRERGSVTPELESLVTSLLKRIDLRMSQLRTIPGKNSFHPVMEIETKFCWPLSFGLITSRFGIRQNPFIKNQTQFHNGLDLAAPPNEPVYAVANGRVVYADWSGISGRLIRIVHDENTETIYAHLSAILVKNDQEVSQGEVIGLLGHSGRSTGHHLHFSMKSNENYLDPLDQLPPATLSFSDATSGVAFGEMEESP